MFSQLNNVSYVGFADRLLDIRGENEIFPATFLHHFLQSGLVDGKVRGVPGGNSIRCSVKLEDCCNLRPDLAADLSTTVT